MTAEVRTDTGKFVSSSWSCHLEGVNGRTNTWFVVIGLGNMVQTIIPSKKRGTGPSIIGPDNELYGKVQKANSFDVGR